MTHYSRDDWGARPYQAHYPLDKDQVEGIALHWPAIDDKLHTVDQCKAALRSFQRYHMDTNAIAEGGASDIAYQVAIDQAGNTYRLRGLRYRSAANGDGDTNRRFGALLLLVAIGEKPTDRLVTAVRHRIAEHRRIFPDSRRIVGHGEIRPEPTACPGQLVQHMIDAHVFEPFKEHK